METLCTKRNPRGLSRGEQPSSDQSSWRDCRSAITRKLCFFLAVFGFSSFSLLALTHGLWVADWEPFYPDPFGTVLVWYGSRDGERKQSRKEEKKDELKLFRSKLKVPLFAFCCPCSYIFPVSARDPSSFSLASFSSFLSLFSSQLF
jgi:hypothetical protein